MPQRDLARRVAELERRLLVHTESFHSEAGSHHKLVRSWPRYWRDIGQRPARLPLARALEALRSAVALLAARGPARVRVPW